jgi:hypothetical protein
MSSGRAQVFPVRSGGQTLLGEPSGLFGQDETSGSPGFKPIWSGPFGQRSSGMQIRILDLDGSLAQQPDLVARHRPATVPAREWGPAIRLGCAFGRFRRFEKFLQAALGAAPDPGPALTLYGSGDFHHVSLALLRRLDSPFNLLLLDNHPDWMRGVPFLHCGTWVYHAARLPQVRRIFHAGGDVDFDNYYRWLAPWRLLRDGKIVVLPGRRPFRRGRWCAVANEPLRPEPDLPADRERLADLLRPYAADLAKYPLYISLDKDVLVEAEAIVNWDSGHLSLAEVCLVLEMFLRSAAGNLIGMDVVGDWSPVRLRGLLRRFLHWTEHPALAVDPEEAARRNERTNLTLLETLQGLLGRTIRAA